LQEDATVRTAQTTILTGTPAGVGTPRRPVCTAPEPRSVDRGPAPGFKKESPVPCTAIRSQALLHVRAGTSLRHCPESRHQHLLTSFDVLTHRVRPHVARSSSSARRVSRQRSFESLNHQCPGAQRERPVEPSPVNDELPAAGLDALAVMAALGREQDRPAVRRIIAGHRVVRRPGLLGWRNRECRHSAWPGCGPVIRSWRRSG
jgi:hypothetical protein